jgi:parallel beta-helix repeat protein
MSTLYRAAFAVACAWLLVAVVAGAAFAQAEPFSLTAAVKAGAPFTLPPGNYGDLTLRTSADITCQPGAVFNTVNAIPPAHDVTFHDCRADMAFAQGKTIDSTPVVRALSVANFHWFGGAITGPVVPPGGTGSGLVEGMPAGVGIAVQNSSGVVISGADISRVRRGITLNGGSDLTLTNNEIHDLRGSPIDGSVAGRITIANNKLHDVYPWNWGAGDHADFIHLWPDAKAAAPIDMVTITGNRLDQGAGEAILGILLGGGPVGYTNLKIDDNLILLGNAQAINVSNGLSGEMQRNVMLQPTGSAVHDAPSIKLYNSDSLAITGNVGPDLYKTYATRPGNTKLPAGPLPGFIAGPTTPLAPLPPAPLAPDTRDSQIADLSAQLSTTKAALAQAALDRDAAKASLAAASDSLASANALAAASGQRLAALMTGIQALAATAAP